MHSASNAEASTVWPFQVRSLTPHMGAEISGIDFSTDLSADTLQAVHRAFLHYQVLVFSAQHISPEQQVQLARGFGEVRSANPRHEPVPHRRLAGDLQAFEFE
ncbi:MAG: TauD/TfdA family dioxygenase [Burkholderiales bacterium]|nr:TauD/TfdA family dioxygenase [Burkholderiales bacterium]